MNQIPPLALIIILLVVLLTIAINLGLIALMRNRSLGDELGRRLRDRKPGHTAQSIQRFQQVLRDPFREERTQLNELSNLVTHLNTPASPDAPVDDSAPAIDIPSEPDKPQSAD